MDLLCETSLANYLPSFEVVKGHSISLGPIFGLVAEDNLQDFSCLDRSQGFLFLGQKVVEILVLRDRA